MAHMRTDANLGSEDALLLGRTAHAYARLKFEVLDLQTEVGKLHEPRDADGFEPKDGLFEKIIDLDNHRVDGCPIRSIDMMGALHNYGGEWDETLADKPRFFAGRLVRRAVCFSKQGGT